MLQIREAMPHEAASLAEIYVKAVDVAYRPFMPAGIVTGFTLEHQQPRWNRKLSLRDRGYSHLVAEQRGRIHGFVGIGPAAFSGHETLAIGEVHSLFVTPEASRSGVGKALLEAGARQLAAEGYCQAVLWVFWDNLPARTFYERVGWHATPRSRRLNPELLAQGAEVSDCRYQQPLTSTSNAFNYVRARQLFSA
ncbi:MAG TPA: GNAT family N-acetyltransferase [Mycobacteriales bacterium]|nr:GNAT family N-acetyltransferase [Mycobacteriales bacterium]